MYYLEIAGTILGLIYLVLEYRASTWLWVASIAMPAIYLEVYYSAGLYADFGISIYYILASIYGLCVWLKHYRRHVEQKGETLPISRMPRKIYFPLAVVSLTIFFVIGLILSHYTDSNVPWADAFTTALSIVALWMLARKFIEQWWVWIVVDIASAMLYVYKDLMFTAGLYALYAVIAVFGYYKWKKLLIK